jgi:predicted MFS family arabinose efflux permease
MADLLPAIELPREVRPLLRNLHFQRLWFVQAATQGGGNLALYAMTILVFATTRSNTAVSALLATYMLPQILFSPFAGVVVDRLNLRWVLAGSNGIRAVLMIGLALAGTTVPMLLLLNLGISFTIVLLTPAEGSMIPRVVPKGQLETAMGIFNLTLQASFAVGFAFAGPVIVALFGPSVALAAVAVLYVAATLACLGLPSAPPLAVAGGTKSATVHPFADPIRDLRDGFTAVRRDREIGRPIIHQAMAAAVAGLLGVLGPALAITVGLQPDQLAVIVVPLGIGVVVGIIALRRFHHLPRRRTAEGGLLILGGLVASLALMPPLQGFLAGAGGGVSVVPLIITISLVAGAAYGITLVSAQTALLENMPAAVRGRVFGVLASIVSTASLITALAAGPVADRVSAPVVIGLAGLAVMALAAWTALRFGPRA